jgi:hypothetical protein
MVVWDASRMGVFVSPLRWASGEEYEIRLLCVASEVATLTTNASP